MPSASASQRQAGWRAERAWADQEFVSIADDEAFRSAVAGIPTRVSTAVKPSAIDALRNVLYDQLVCRSLGSLDCYETRFGTNRNGPLDDVNQKRIERTIRRHFKEELPVGWSKKEVFARLWTLEYGDDHRFDSVALGEHGALIAIGEVRDAASLPPKFFLSDEEVARWVALPGLAMRTAESLHVGPNSLESVLRKHGTCVYAQVPIIVRSKNEDVWSWFTNWYLDPSDGRWQIHGATAVTWRGPYLSPM